MTEKVKLRDIVLAQGACTDSAYAGQYGLSGTFAPIADFTLLKKAAENAEQKGLQYHVGNILSSDRFYGDDTEASSKWSKMGVLAVEMEAAALYMNAAYAKKRALAICTVSDHILTGESTSAEERQNSFTQMMEVALNVAVKMA